MKIFLPLLFATALVTGAGCKSVFVDRPFGEKPVKLEKAEWEGTWVAGAGAFVVRVADAEKGRLQLAWVEEKDGTFKLETCDLHVREVEGSLFLTMEEKNDEGKIELQWARAKKDDNQLLVWIPKRDKFRELVQQGALPGVATTNRVELRNLQPSHFKRIESQQDGPLFDWEDPMIVRRLENK